MGCENLPSHDWLDNRFTPETVEAARVVVAGNARSVEECREFLDMLAIGKGARLTEPTP